MNNAMDFLMDIAGVRTTGNELDSIVADIQAITNDFKTERENLMTRGFLGGVQEAIGMVDEQITGDIKKQMQREQNLVTAVKQVAENTEAMDSELKSRLRYGGKA